MCKYFLESAVTVKDAMHKNVEWVEPTTTLAVLAKKMRDLDIGAIPDDHAL